MQIPRVIAPLLCALALLNSSPDVSGSAAFAEVRARLAPICRLVLEPQNKFTRVVPPAAALRSLASSANAVVITVNYTGFTPAAQTAFQAAVDIWKSQLTSSRPVVINAAFVDLGANGLLGQSGPNVFRDFPGTPRTNTWFAKALADRVTGMDISPGNADIPNAQFNSNSSIPWYFGTDGVTPANTVDFESVVLHELGHGLGFLGGGTVSGGLGTVIDQGSPYVFDTSVSDGNGRSVLDPAIYPDNSSALANLFTSVTNLYWNGANGISGSGGVRPRLYAPSPFEAGSTYSHLDDATYPAGNINSLMTHAIGYAEAIHVPGPITLGMLKDMGWGAGSGCIYQLSATSAQAPAGASTATVSVFADAGCPWNAATNSTFVRISSGASGSGNGNIVYSVDPNANSNQRVATLTIAGNTFTITQLASGPGMSIETTTMQFFAMNNGSGFTQQTPAQTVRLTQSGSGTVTWSAVSNQPWLVVSPTSGTGSAALSVSLKYASGLPRSGSVSGLITVTLTGASNPVGPINVALNLSPGAPPFGVIDTPVDNATGVTGSLPVTGWALDDVGVTSVKIYRQAVAGEGGSLVFVGDAVQIEGARPDVAAAYPNIPFNTRAGWGYLLLTNVLPNQGDGTFRLQAYATDADGGQTLLGTRTITCTNTTAIDPFGAIDTPGQGETITASSYNNFGWVLSRGLRRADPPGGGTVTAVIDGVPVGSPTGWTSRPDISALFPVAQYSGVNTALGVLTFSTAGLANGLHTIAWSVTDNQNPAGAAGIGSRYFTVSNGAGMVLDSAARNASAASPRIGSDSPPAAVLSSPTETASVLEQEIAAAPFDDAVITGRRGFDLAAPFRRLRPDASGVVTFQSEEVDRVELRLGANDSRQYSGYVRVGDKLTPLPIGSQIDPATGTFTWQPGVGFVGQYDFVFVRLAAGHAVSRQEVRVVLNPKTSGRVGAQVIIDVPTRQQDVGRPFVIAGWAIDLDADVDTGIDALHVWAYPLAGGDPIFLGASVYGGERPDVAAIYGSRFKSSGYGLTVQGLEPGNYDLAVFGHSTVTGEFVPAKTVRVTVR